MFLSRLSSSSSSFLPHCNAVLCRAGFKSSTSCLPRFAPAPRPWWSVQGFPPWHPRLLHSHPSAQQAFGTRSLHPGTFSDSCRSFYTTAGLMMERPDRDRGPPYKRIKAAEERRSFEEREGCRAAVTGVTGGKKDGRMEHQHQDPRADRHPQPNQHFTDGSRDRGKNGAGRNVSRENIRDKDVDRTKYWNKNRPWKDSTSRDEATNKKSEHRQAGCKDPQRCKGLQTGTSRTQTPKSRPEQDAGYTEKPKPNPWFKDRGPGKEGEHRRNTKGPEEKLRDKSGDGGRGRGLLPQPCNTTCPSNPWQVAGASRQPPPPGTSPPDGQQDEATSVKPLQRHWEMSPACSTYPRPPGSSTTFDFSVMSYNILSQELLQDNAYLYRHCNPSILPWEYRLPNLLAEIQQHDADILCLQEVQEDHYENQIKPSLQALGYHCEFKKRTGRKPDGCAIIFKSSRLSLLSSNPVEFFRPRDAVLDRDNVGLVVLLRPNDAAAQSDPSAFICVANTHLLYNPRRGDVKLSQLAILLAEISRLSHLPDGTTNPVVLCGDFNSTPWSPLYSFLTTGCLEYGGLLMGTVSGQENPPRGHRLLTPPIWSQSLGINHQCQYEKRPAAEPSSVSPRAVEGAISNLTVEDLATKAAAAVFNRAKIEHGLKLQSSYQHRLMPDGRPEITTCHSHTAMTVDYILFTPELITPPSFPGVRGLQLLGRLSLVGQSELEEVRGLPNEHHSSDHLPLLARFRFRH